MLRFMTMVRAVTGFGCIALALLAGRLALFDGMAPLDAQHVMALDVLAGIAFAFSGVNWFHAALERRSAPPLALLSAALGLVLIILSGMEAGAYHRGLSGN